MAGAADNRQAKCEGCYRRPTGMLKDGTYMISLKAVLACATYNGRLCAGLGDALIYI